MKHDIICLSEIHCSNEDNISINGYNCFKLCRPVTQKINRHFGGIVIYYKTHLKNGIKFLEHTNDDYVWFKLCKYFFNLEEDYYICYAYVPPENSSYYKNRKQDTLSFIENDIMKYSQKGYISILGDLNARTGCKDDIINNDSNIGNGCDFYTVDNDVFVRKSEDRDVSARGNRILDLCIGSRLRIANGRVTGDVLGKFTCHKPSGSSVVDYVIVDECIFKNVLYVHIGNYNGQLSDHCLVSWAMKCCYTRESHTQTQTKSILFPKQFKWSKEYIMKFQTALKSNNISALIQKNSNKIYSVNENVNELVEDVTNILLQAAEMSLPVKEPKKKPQTPKHKKWFDESLEKLKRDVTHNSYLLQKFPNNPHIRHNFFRSLKTYNKTRKYKARQFKENIIQQLEDLKDNNPNKY